MKKRCRFDRALPCSNHDETLTGKATEIAVFRRVRRQFIPDGIELRRTARECPETTRDHDAARSDSSTVVENKAEAIVTGVDTDDATMVDIRKRVALKPSAVGDKVLERNLRPKRRAAHAFERLRRQDPSGI
jgi:hypothetical protein